MKLMGQNGQNKPLERTKDAEKLKNLKTICEITSY